MQTRKQFAVSLGLANEGRGRMSREALAAIDKAISEGMTFSDMDKHHSNAKFGKRAGEKNAHTGPKPRQIQLKSESSAGDIPMEAPPTYSKNDYWTYQNEKGKSVKVDGRQVCIPCGYSLMWHKCDNPSTVTADGVQSLKVHFGG